MSKALRKNHRPSMWGKLGIVTIVACVLATLAIPSLAPADETKAEPQLAYSLINSEEQTSTQNDGAGVTSDEAEDDAKSIAVSASVVENLDDLDALTQNGSDASDASFMGLRVEGPDAGSVEYRVKSLGLDWGAWTTDGNVANVGESVAAVQIKLAGSLAEQYSVLYRVHAMGKGWLGWAANGDTAGSEAPDASVDSLEIVLVPTSTDVGALLAGQASAAYLNDQSDVPEEDVAQGEGHSEDIESSAEAQDDVLRDSLEGEVDPDDVTLQSVEPSVTYRSHVENIGWQDWVADGETSGTTGRSLRVEALSLKLGGVSGSIEYRAHVKNIGWQDWVADGETSGTTGRGLRIEALQIRLTGAVANTYDVYYRTHVRDIGWTEWVKNGETSGTTGRSLRVEAVEVKLVARNGGASPNDDPNSGGTVPQNYSAPTIKYQAHVQDDGWQAEVADGAIAGTTGRSLRAEALTFSLEGVEGGVEYRAHVQDVGWQDWAQNGGIAGTVGRGLRVEAIQLRLTGDAASRYDVYYRAHVSDIGWMTWAKNGETSGTEGISGRVEAVEAVLVAKGSAAPSNQDAAVAYSSLSRPSVSYSSNVVATSWQSYVSNGSTSGSLGESTICQFRASLDCDSAAGGISYRVTTNGTDWTGAASNGAIAGTGTYNLKGVRIKLTGDVATYCDVWYRVYVPSSGWLGWTRNDAYAGSSIPSDSLEGVQVLVRSKSAGAPGSTVGAFVTASRLNGIDIASYQAGIDVRAVNADFVFVKATEGTWYKNQSSSKGYSYKTWANQALASGKLLGFYHYADGGNAVEEADYFYEAIKDYKGRAVVALDWEGQGNDVFESGMDVIWCKTFLDRIATLMDCKPLIYMSKNVTREYNWKSVASKYPLWAAQYPNYNTTGYQSSPWTDSRSFGAWSSPTIYQYTSVGRISGYGEDLDLDLFYGNASDWRALQ